MCFSQLSILNNIVENSTIEKINNFLLSSNANTIILLSEFAFKLDISEIAASTILDKLSEADIIYSFYIVKCPNCDLSINQYDNVCDIEKMIYCYNCDENVSICEDDIYIAYKLTDSFCKGQQNDNVGSLSDFAAQHIDRLAYKLSQCDHNFNNLLYDLKNEEYKKLETLYFEAFEQKHSKTKEAGNKFEALCEFLIKRCKAFEAANVNTDMNQIDCYVRNKTRFIETGGVLDYNRFIVECKNENNTPSIDYFNKLHSILETSSIDLGIIMSKFSAPSTFIKNAKIIWLHRKKVIISIDRNDIYNIVFEKYNLLECIDSKIEKIKAMARSDLIKVGLYNA